MKNIQYYLHFFYFELLYFKNLLEKSFARVDVHNFVHNFKGWIVTIQLEDMNLNLNLCTNLIEN